MVDDHLCGDHRLRGVTRRHRAPGRDGLARRGGEARPFRRGLAVVVGEADDIAGRGPGAEVARRRPRTHRVQAPRRRQAFEGLVEAARSRAVVHDDDLERLDLLLGERVEAAREARGAVPGRHDDGGRHRSLTQDPQREGPQAGAEAAADPLGNPARRAAALKLASRGGVELDRPVARQARVAAPHSRLAASRRSTSRSSSSIRARSCSDLALIRPPSTRSAPRSAGPGSRPRSAPRSAPRPRASSSRRGSGSRAAARGSRGR